jgi:hypothetical protein
MTVEIPSLSALLAIAKLFLTQNVLTVSLGYLQGVGVLSRVVMN